MNWIIQPRAWFFLVAVACAGLLGFALYKQHMDFVDPCPLCVFQRVAFLWIGAVSLVAALHGPGPAGRWTYGAAVMLGGLGGAIVALRHLWLQRLPPDQVPDCGMGLNYMLETMPFREVLAQVFSGSGECAEVLWTFLGLSMPGWTLVWYSGITVVTIVVVAKANLKKA
jgi:disulfide bond formation protein DsbB